KAESLMSYDTYQFEDYSKVVADGIDQSKKKKRREEIFPVDCEKAFNMGVKLVEDQIRLPTGYILMFIGLKVKSFIS
ncbi:MAG: hypothetical protein JXL81_11360, partial [Deltaproteobacteria bacterium]|nr:hypothetical protein [Deltaproteobacteria bacterium]